MYFLPNPVHQPRTAWHNKNRGERVSPLYWFIVAGCTSPEVP